MSNPYGYTLALALEDFVPVALAGAGAWWLATVAVRAVPAVRLIAYAGVASTVLGGLAKASWKLLVAADVADIAWLQELLFPFLALGFTLLAWSLVSAVKQRPAMWWPYAVVLGLAAGMAAGAERMMPLFVVAVVMSLAVTAYAIILARRQQDDVAILFFALQVIGVFGLVPLQDAEQTYAMQWLEQGINTGAQAAFAYGAWRLLRRARVIDVTTHDTTTVEATA